MLIERIRLAVPSAYHRAGEVEQKASVEAEEALRVAPDGKRKRQGQPEHQAGEGRSEYEHQAPEEPPERAAPLIPPKTSAGNLGHVDIVA